MYLWKVNLHSFQNNFFFQCTFKAKLSFLLKNLRPHFQNSFVPSVFFVCFLCLASGWKTKKLLKTEHQSTFVYIQFEFEVCHNLIFLVLSQSEFLSCITIWVVEFHHNFSFWVSSQFEFDFFVCHYCHYRHYYHIGWKIGRF